MVKIQIQNQKKLTEEIINYYIEKSCRKGYENGVTDGRKEVLSKAYGLAQKGVNVPERRDLTPLGMITFPDKNKGLKNAIIDSLPKLEKEDYFLGKTINEFRKVAISQEEKGIAKYGHELRPNDNYNWLDMALEELVDATKYIIAEKAKRGEI